jgi:hypothetical protein
MELLILNIFHFSPMHTSNDLKLMQHFKGTET